ncbi:MAG TPA: hypothetical protein PKN86_16715 [Candidatus Obscuribacter sp.]|nr:hypothetical protein [Candidatus Obscuribacter sp.]MBK9280189.1 hypothetical protein [Candidatus Obscuribacter sp.]HMX47938.1 hypothetical protein [Candidatus Obscuribacter sp.]HNA75021.1 hypothetical protein [Candidatus Obscuribacter sp.]HNB15888.1 hypothetical protein [Candidatus Obscuribacter sp.]
MKDSPEIVGIFLCERILQDVFRPDSVTLVNVHNSIGSHAFPTLVPVLYAFAQLRGFKKVFSYKFNIIDPKGTVIAASAPGNVEPGADPTFLLKVVSAFPALVFEGAGNYAITLEIDGSVMGEVPFKVEQLAQPEPAAV